MVALAATLPAFGLLEVSSQAAPREPAAGARPASGSGSASVAATGPIQLQVRRLGNAVELVVEGAGPAPQLQQSSRANGWQGKLTTARPSGLRSGPQRLSLPELGFQSVSLDGSGTSYNLSVTPMPGVSMARPVVSADGVNLILTFPSSPQASLQTNRLDLSQPGAIPLPTYAPPLQPRAVAPPLGDMAVGSIYMKDPGALAISGPRITLNFKNVDASEALATLARIGSYGFVYVPEYAFANKEDAALYKSSNEFNVATERGDSNSDKISGQSKIIRNLRPVTASFVGESYANAFNSLLAAAGLQARLQGRTVFAGPNLLLSPYYGSQVSKIYRLNQATALSASQYLASLGALIYQPETIRSTTSTGTSTNTGGGSAGTTSSATSSTSSQTTEIKQYGGKSGPLLGIKGTIDNRLSTITLIGDPRLVAVAESYLKQIDLRQRQVALSVKILDVNLDNDSTMDNSFAIRLGNNFIVNDGGQLLGAFGDNLPPTYNPLTGQFSGVTANPGTAYPKDQFYDFLRAQIVSQSTKLLASPTLILQENPAELRSEGGGGASGATAGALDDYNIDSPIGRKRANEGVVRVGTNVITQYEVNSSASSAGGGEGANNTGSNVITCDPTLSTAGLVLGARIEKIDDNGFVTFALSPSVSAVTDREEVPGCGFIDILSIRRLDTGALRVRDGQTLIMTGVISDFDRAEVTKWPILGDLPLIGSLFRKSGNRREKRELVIMVTPKIINDVEGGVYGYGYQPSSPQARELMGSSAY